MRLLQGSGFAAVQSRCEIGGISADSLRGSKVRNGMKHSDWD